MVQPLPGRITKKTLRFAGAGKGIALAACLLLAAACFAASGRASDTLFEKSCGDNNTGKRVLIAYDTKHGSTADIAEKAGDVLCENGLRVDVRLAYRVTDISAYDVIILGSPVYYSTFLPGTLQFLERHKTTLASKTVAAFVVSVDVDNATGQVSSNVRTMVNATVFNKYSTITITEPVGLLPGKLLFKEIFPVEIIGFKLSNFAETGNLVNDAFVRTWAETLAPLIK